MRGQNTYNEFIKNHIKLNFKLLNARTISLFSRREQKIKRSGGSADLKKCNALRGEQVHPGFGFLYYG